MIKSGIELPQEVSPENLSGFCRLQQLEFWLREMLYVELKGTYGPEWWDVATQALRRARGGGGIPAAKSMKADKKHPHMATPENDPLWFISFDSLLKILFDRRIWPICKGYFTTKSLLRARFEELRPIRNRIAHGRRLLPDDVTRVERSLHDFNKGFWNFCVSYNDRYRFKGILEHDPIYSYYFNKSTWARDKTGTWINVDVDFLLRPSCNRHVRSRVPKRGGIYNLIYIADPERGRYLDYGSVLRATEHHHEDLLHIILDPHACLLRVTVPASVEETRIIAIMESFYQACLNSQATFSVQHPRGYSDLVEAEASGTEYAGRLQAFDRFSAGWPHYVVSPSHGLAFLDRTNWPCSFFG